VRKGDSLWDISRRFYGAGRHWPRIFNANRDKIETPSLIHPGQQLLIPDPPADGSDN
jgi:nucleoid-associated protein YgaU